MPANHLETVRNWVPVRSRQVVARRRQDKEPGVCACFTNIGPVPLSSSVLFSPPQKIPIGIRHYSNLVRGLFSHPSATTQTKPFLLQYLDQLRKVSSDSPGIIARADGGYCRLQ